MTASQRDRAIGAVIDSVQHGTTWRHKLNEFFLLNAATKEGVPLTDMAGDQVVHHTGIPDEIDVKLPEEGLPVQPPEGGLPVSPPEGGLPVQPLPQPPQQPSVPDWLKWLTIILVACVTMLIIALGLIMFPPGGGRPVQPLPPDPTDSRSLFQSLEDQGLHLPPDSRDQ